MRVEQNNSVQQFSALNAFKSSKNIRPAEKEEQILQSSEDRTPKIMTLSDRIDVDEVRECAKYVGEFNITDDDIRYGLLYGRSVIAEFLC
ncbi:hypothetical protein IJ750_02095 [bacterium]|nr:hypothetical protein [bacterium]MBR1775852.1 hypothetical protein [bacterium]